MNSQTPKNIFRGITFACDQDSYEKLTFLIFRENELQRFFKTFCQNVSLLEDKIYYISYNF